jgi:hypothetical protein
MICVVVHEVQATLVLIDRLVVALPPQKVIAEFVSLKIKNCLKKYIFATLLQFWKKWEYQQVLKLIIKKRSFSTTNLKKPFER